MNVSYINKCENNYPIENQILGLIIVYFPLLHVTVFTQCVFLIEKSPVWKSFLFGQPNHKNGFDLTILTLNILGALKYLPKGANTHVLCCNFIFTSFL